MRSPRHAGAPSARVVLFVAIAGGVLGTATSARADGRGYVELTVTASDDQAASLASTLRELLARLGLRLRVVSPASIPAEPPPGPLDGPERARASVDETAADHVTIVVTPLRQGVAGPTVERTFTKGDTSAIVTEQAAHVVHSTLESILATEDDPADGAPRSVSPPPLSSPASGAEPAGDTAPRIVAVPRAGPSLAATAFLEGRGLASGTGPVVGGGAEAAFTAWRGFGRPRFWISGAYNAPFSEQTADVTVQTTVTSLRAGATVALFAADAFGLDAGLGAGADLLHTVPSNPGPLVTLGPTTDLVDPVVVARVAAGVRVAAGARLVVAVDVDADLASHRYVTALASTATASVFDPWPVRPAVLVGLCVPLVGSLGCYE